MGEKDITWLYGTFVGPLRYARSGIFMVPRAPSQQLHLKLRSGAIPDISRIINSVMEPSDVILFCNDLDPE